MGDYDGNCRFKDDTAAKVCLVGWILTAQNVADTMTKSPAEAKRNASFRDWVHLEQFRKQNG